MVGHYPNKEELAESLELLDKTDPYNNGLTLGDVNETEVVKKDGNSVTLHLIY
jgi:hypothetical protein